MQRLEGIYQESKGGRRLGSLLLMVLLAVLQSTWAIGWEVKLGEKSRVLMRERVK